MSTKTRRMLITDQDLRQQGGLGDGKAMDLVVRRYQDTVYGLCVYITVDTEASKDMTQETFIRVLRGLGRLQAGH